VSEVSTPTSSPTRDDVLGWLEGLRSRLEQVARELAPLLEEQQRLRSQEALLTKLLVSFDGSPNEVGAPAAHGSDEVDSGVVADGSTGDYVRDAALSILRDVGGGPMHINDMHAQFLARGYRVPGAGRPANLTAHLGRAASITSPRRGFYAIASDRPSAGQKKQRRRRKRR
jgi:hypothetical protein